MPRPKKGERTPGSGKPKGYRAPKTLAKEQARELVRQLITAGLKPMIQRQMAHAQGIGHVYSRDKTGKYSKIEDSEVVDRLLTQGTEGTDYWIFMKDPSTQAFSELMNRALDKPKEQEQEITFPGGLEIAWKSLKG
jgi:hypothetical protein